MRRPVAQFALAGIVVLAVFGVAAVLVLRSLAGDEALRDARQFAELAGQGIVEPTVVPSLLEGNPAAVAAVDRAVNERVLGERVVRVKLWDADGRDRLLGRAAPHRRALSARRGEARRAPDRVDACRAQRPLRTGEPVRAGPGRPLRGLPADPRTGRDAAPLRDVPAPERGRSHRASHLAPVRRPAARQPPSALARAGAARVAALTTAAANAGGA